eukprot:7203834-Pyramimonas_sp.AAC.1
MSFGTTSTSADKDSALRDVQAKIYKAIYEEGTKWTPSAAQAGAPAEVDDAAEKFYIFILSSGSAAKRGTGIWMPPSPNEWRGQARATATRACSDRPNTQ